MVGPLSNTGVEIGAVYILGALRCCNMPHIEASELTAEHNNCEIHSWLVFNVVPEGPSTNTMRTLGFYSGES